MHITLTSKLIIIESNFIIFAVLEHKAWTKLLCHRLLGVGVVYVGKAG
jgi:hypothetical protein